MPYAEIVRLDDGLWHLPESPAGKDARTACGLALASGVELRRIGEGRPDPDPALACKKCFPFLKKGAPQGKRQEK